VQQTQLVIAAVNAAALLPLVGRAVTVKLDSSVRGDMDGLDGVRLVDGHACVSVGETRWVQRLQIKVGK